MVTVVLKRITVKVLRCPYRSQNNLTNASLPEGNGYGAGFLKVKTPVMTSMTSLWILMTVAWPVIHSMAPIGVKQMGV